MRLCGASAAHVTQLWCDLICFSFSLSPPLCLPPSYVYNGAYECWSARLIRGIHTKIQWPVCLLRVVCASSARRHTRFSAPTAANPVVASFLLLLTRSDLQKHSHAVTFPKVDTLLACRKDKEGQMTQADMTQHQPPSINPHFESFFPHYWLDKLDSWRWKKKI